MSEDLISYRVLRDEEARAAVFDWWARLTGHSTDYAGNQHKRSPATGERAVLRRARSPDDALLTEGFRWLWFGLPSGLRRNSDMAAWASVAVLLAQVRENQPGVELAAAMAREARPGEGKPRVSELRFHQLQHSEDLYELHRRLRRLLGLLRNDRGNIQANVLSLADNILHWHREQRWGPDLIPDRRLPVRWATAYFTELARLSRSA
jgi:CRISPR system Cascade subunit CasB